MKFPEGSARPVPAFAAPHWISITLAGLAYALFVALRWSEAYIDFGDGNYLYIGSRIAEGAVVYRDILAPQPPCHLFLGAFLIKLSQWAGLGSALYVVRAFSLILHLATFLLVVDLARTVWGRAWAGPIGGIFYLLLPIGLSWSLGYQSEPLEILFLLLMIRFAIVGGRAADVTTGVFGALAAFTNATAVPFLFVLIVFMLIRNPRRAAWIAIPAIGIAAAVITPLEIWTGGAFFDNVFLNQVGTYPPDFLRYAWSKLVWQGGQIIFLEGFFMVFAALGFFRFLRESPLGAEARDGFMSFSLATLCSFLYVTKGGTMQYIFSLSEPAVAILASGEIVALSAWAGGILSERKDRIPAPAESGDSERAAPSPTPIAIKVAGLILVLIFTWAMLGGAIGQYSRLWKQTAFELPDLKYAPIGENGRPAANVQQVKQWIDRFSEPGDDILAPPYYAFLTDRKVWGDYSELLIWSIKYWTETEAGVEGDGRRKIDELVGSIEARDIPLIILDMGQTGRIPAVIEAIKSNYVQPDSVKEPHSTWDPNAEAYIYATRDSRLAFYVPVE